MKILVTASTFPASDTDPVPAFVKDQIIALKKIHPEIEFAVLAPHDARSQTRPFATHDSYDEYRFHYFWLRRCEKLAGRGIMPMIKQNPLYYLLIPFLFAAEFFALWRLTRTFKPDVLYAHWFTPQGVTTGMVSRLTRTPFVYTSHALDVAVWHKIPLIGTPIVRHFSRTARAITVVSEQTKAKLRTFFDEARWREVETKLAIIPMGVHLPSQPAAPKKTNGQHILFVGRLAEKKGVHYLLPAFAKLLQKFPQATLTIAGDGSWQERLQAQATELKLSDTNLIFAGYTTGDKKQALMNEADIFVVPSIIAADGDAEGLPVTLMEGMAASKLCIATFESGADGIIKSGESGFLVPQKDEVALADALTKALTLSAAERQKLRHNAHLAARQFDWPVVATRHYQHLFQKFEVTQ